MKLSKYFLWRRDMKNKKSKMEIRHLGHRLHYSDVIVEVQILLTRKIYYYLTSRYIEEQFLKKCRKSYKGGWDALNYLKDPNNAQRVDEKGNIITH